MVVKIKNRWWRILIYRFGLDDGTPHSLEEAGKRFNISRERVRQIENHILRNLRHPLPKKQFKRLVNAILRPNYREKQ